MGVLVIMMLSFLFMAWTGGLKKTIRKPIKSYLKHRKAVRTGQCQCRFCKIRRKTQSWFYEI